MSNENDEKNNDQSLCKVCNRNPPDPSFTFPLCSGCRRLLIKRPYPVWIKGFIVLIGCMLLYSALKFPHTFKACTAQKAGKAAEAQHNYAAAISEYQKILAIFPQSHEHKARLAVCLLRSGEVGQASAIIKTIDEKSLSKDVITELNFLISRLTPPATNE